MSLTFDKVDEILKSYGLVPHIIKNGQCTEYAFENRFLNNRKSNVATQVKPLLNGGVGGYLYVGHLKRYDKHPRRTKMGHIPIGRMTEKEFISTLKKVIKDYI